MLEIYLIGSCLQLSSSLHDSVSDSTEIVTPMNERIVDVFWSRIVPILIIMECVCLYAVTWTVNRIHWANQGNKEGIDNSLNISFAIIRSLAVRFCFWLIWLLMKPSKFVMFVAPRDDFSVNWLFYWVTVGFCVQTCPSFYFILHRLTNWFAITSVPHTVICR